MKETLLKIGFDEKEADIYLALLTLGQTSVSQILKHCHIERRTIYDVLERLIQKGKASFHEENGTRIYRATKPEIVLEELKSQEEEFEKIVPSLRSLEESPSSAKVEILRGIKGVQSIFHEIIEGRYEHYAFGDLSPMIYEYNWASPMKNILKRIEEKGLKEKVIYAKGELLTKLKGSEYRCMPKNKILPTPTVIYGDVTTQYIYTQPMTIIKITSKEIAETHRQYFELFWKQAQKE